MMYDHTSFHTEERPELSEEQAATHIACYYTWAVSQNLHSAAAAALPEFQAWQVGRLSGSQFILKAFRGGIDAGCFNETGQRFTEFYYVDEEEGYGRFMEDYFLTLGLDNQDGFYRVTWQPDVQEKLNHAFQVAFNQWKNSLKPDNA